MRNFALLFELTEKHKCAFQIASLFNFNALNLLPQAER